MQFANHLLGHVFSGAHQMRRRAMADVAAVLLTVAAFLVLVALLGGTQRL